MGRSGVLLPGTCPAAGSGRPAQGPEGISPCRPLCPCGAVASYGPLQSIFPAAGLCLTIFSADCIPVLLLDPVRRCAAAVHAGWRGTALGIAARAALRMREDYGCRPEHIRAAIGPGISPCCFLTRDDVPGALRDGLGSQAETCIRPAEDGRWHVDLKGANALWLRRAGLSPEHIALCPDCNACRTDRFWSHRVMGERRGSMAAIIQLL